MLGLTAAVLLSINLNAQEPAQTAPATTKSNTGLVWSVGLSGSVVDDDGEPFKNLFNVGESWHFLPFPTRVHVDVAINPKWSFEAALTYNMMQAGKMLNNVELTEDQQFVAFDANAKYHFLGESKVFDPYGVAGLGFTFRSALQYQTPTLNAGIGANIWLVPSFGLNLQSTVKLKMISNSSSYMLHSFGVVYKFGQN